MTRIIGGSAGGRRLQTLSGSHTRPTSDRVREGLFSALESALGSVNGLRFLDLYAGSGAVGLEAGSRGAAGVTFVESDRRAASVVRANAKSLAFPVDVVSGTVARFLAGSPRAPYDIVFLDPPYTMPTTEVATALKALRERGWLTDGSLVVVERSSRTEPPSWPQGLVADRSRRYGETTLWYGHAASDR